MALQKPSIPKGTRDFSPVEMARRNYIFSTIESAFKLYGYQPIETPAMENLSTLLGKYGEEGDKLLFKILNSGDFTKGIESSQFTAENANALSVKMCDRGLRYDLTVPFARFVVQHQNEITFPFKRYQIQPVWRADRPQKGRYREFYQCDVDVIGSDSLLNELELIHIVRHIFGELGVGHAIKLNNRKILSGMAQVVNQSERLIDITVAIDKIDKIGIEAVNKELLEKGIPQEAIDRLQPIILLSGSNQERLSVLSEFLSTSEIGMKGVEEMQEILSNLSSEDENVVELDLSLARGLNYYTGVIIEVKATEVEIGSICGGGRYDDLTGIFGLKGMSGVGISFGADRIYDVMLQQNLFPESLLSSSQVMFANFGDKEAVFCLPLLANLRKIGISAELYPDTAKMKKQFDYANKKGIPFAAIVGATEMESGNVSVKNMITGSQESVAVHELVSFFKGVLQ